VTEFRGEQLRGRPQLEAGKPELRMVTIADRKKEKTEIKFSRKKYVICVNIFPLIFEGCGHLATA